MNSIDKQILDRIRIFYSGKEPDKRIRYYYYLEGDRAILVLIVSRGHYLVKKGIIPGGDRLAPKKDLKELLEIWVSL